LSRPCGEISENGGLASAPFHRYRTNPDNFWIRIVITLADNAVKGSRNIE